MWQSVVDDDKEFVSNKIVNDNVFVNNTKCEGEKKKNIIEKLYDINVAL